MRMSTWASLRASRTAPKKRARELLNSLLTPTQRRSLEDHGWFNVKGSDGYTYCVSLLEEGRNVSLPELGRTYEVHLKNDDRVTFNRLAEDRVIAQLLMLQTNAPRLRRMSCRA